jgi:putative transposase
LAAALLQMDQVEVSPDLISRMTDAVHEDLRAWRRRPLEPVYPLVFLDATIIVYSVPNKPAGPPKSG